MKDFTRHKTCIFGVQESGKTYWAKQMFKRFKKPLVYVVNNDDGWAKEKGIYVWKGNRLNLEKDFQKFLDNAHKWAMEGKIDAIIIDEADLFFRSNYDISPKLQDLILNHRHIPEGKGTALWFMTRRPQDIPTKIVESSKYLIIFKLEGVNAIKRFYDIHPDIPHLIERLDYRKKNFIIKELGESPFIHKPLPPPKK